MTAAPLALELVDVITTKDLENAEYDEARGLLMAGRPSLLAIDGTVSFMFCEEKCIILKPYWSEEERILVFLKRIGHPSKKRLVFRIKEKERWRDGMAVIFADYGEGIFDGTISFWVRHKRGKVRMTPDSVYVDRQIRCAALVAHRHIKGRNSRF